MSSLVLEKVGQLWLILTNFVFQKSFLSKRNYQSQKRLIGLLLGSNPYTCIYALKYHTMLWCISSLCVQKMIMCFRNKAFLVFVKMYLYFYSLFTWPLQTISLVSACILLFISRFHQAILIHLCIVSHVDVRHMTSVLNQ